MKDEITKIVSRYGFASSVHRPLLFSFLYSPLYVAQFTLWIHSQRPLLNPHAYHTIVSRRGWLGSSTKSLFCVVHFHGHRTYCIFCITKQSSNNNSPSSSRVVSPSPSRVHRISFFQQWPLRHLKRQRTFQTTHPLLLIMVIPNTSHSTLHPLNHHKHIHHVVTHLLTRGGSSTSATSLHDKTKSSENTLIDWLNSVMQTSCTSAGSSPADRIRIPVQRSFRSAPSCTHHVFFVVLSRYIFNGDLN